MSEVMECSIPKEDEFRHLWGLNKGFSQAWKKVDYCLFLSTNAKQLYRNLSGYVYEGNKECFPAQDLLRLGLRWGKSRFSEALDELRDKGFITTEKRGFGKSLGYHFEELRTVRLLYHSEMIWGIARQFGWMDRDRFNSIVSDYEETDLFKEVNNAENPLLYEDVVVAWFLNNLGQPPQEEESVEEQQETNEPPKSKTTVIPRVFQLDKDIQTEPETGKRKPTARNYKDLDPQFWNTNHLCQYFRDAYEREFGFKYPGGDSGKELGMMKRLLELREDSALIKTHIDNYMKLPQYPMKVITGFCMSHVQSNLDRYLKTGEAWGESNEQVGKPIQDSGFDERYYK